MSKKPCSINNAFDYLVMSESSCQSYLPLNFEKAHNCLMDSTLMFNCTCIKLAGKQDSDKFSKELLSDQNIYVRVTCTCPLVLKKPVIDLVHSILS